MLSVAEVRLGYPRSTHSLKEEVLLCATWGYVQYPQDLLLVTTNTYIKQRRLGINEPMWVC